MGIGRAESSGNGVRQQTVIKQAGGWETPSGSLTHLSEVSLCVLTEARDVWSQVGALSGAGVAPGMQFELLETESFQA